MLNMKDSMKSLMILSILMLCSCSFLGKISYDTCSNFTYNRQVTTTVFDEKLGPSKSILVRVQKSSDNAKKDLACILKSEYTALQKEEKKKLVLLTLHAQEDGIIVVYGMYFNKDILLEMQFTPNNNEGYILAYSNLFPLKNVITVIRNPKSEVLVLPLTQKYGILTKVQALELLSKITNGLFLKASE